MNFQHGEAFLLMVYRCEKCGHEINIWNSRDGVTPFITLCTKDGCNGDMAHVFPYQTGRREVRFYSLPPQADMVFVSMTEEVAKAHAKSHIDLSKKIGNMDGLSDTEIEEIQHGMAVGLYNEGRNPNLVTVEEYNQHYKLQSLN